MKHTERIQYIDLYRGIGILLMVLGHVGIWGTFDYWVHGFHMPMFFFISGYLYTRHEETAHYLRTKARQLLIPYICYGLLSYVALLITEQGSGWEPLCRLFTVNTSGLAIGSAIWFLTALFWVYVIYQIVESLSLSFYVRTIVYYALALLGCMEIHIAPGRFPLALGPGLVGLGLFHTARWIRDCTGRVHVVTTVSSRWILFIWVIADAVLIFVNDEINMREGRYGILPLFWFNALSCSLLLYNLCREYWNRDKDSRVLGFLNRELTYIGQNAIIYVCLNQLILYLLTLAWDISGYGSLARFLLKLIRFLLAMILLRVCSIVIHRTPLRVTTGQ